MTDQANTKASIGNRRPSQIKFGGDLLESVHAYKGHKENIAAKLLPPNEHPVVRASRSTDRPTGETSETPQTMSTSHANQGKKQKINVYIYPYDQPYVIPLNKVKLYTVSI